MDVGGGNYKLFGSGPVLAYGEKDVQGGYSCTSKRKGITCTVIAGTGRGRGFLINAARITKVGP